MPNQEHLKLIQQGVDAWNAWRRESPDTRPELREADLSKASLAGANLNQANLNHANLNQANLHEADLSGADLTWAFLSNANLSGANLYEANLTDVYLITGDISHANLSGANLSGAVLSLAGLKGTDFGGAYLGGALLSMSDLSDANLSGANLTRAILREANLTSADLRRANLSEGVNLSRANLSGANLTGANLYEADLSGAHLFEANLSGVNLSHADLSAANLSGAILEGASLVETNLKNADLNGCRIYGISVWNIIVENGNHSNLIITPPNEPEITLDNLEVAQFVYLLLRNEKIRQVIDTVTSKAVLLLGRFSEERKSVLNLIRDNLRDRGYVPILFDFKPSAARDLTETIQLLANMAKFVIADLTDAKSIPQELSHIIPNLPSVPVQPIILASQREYAMFEHWPRFDSVLPLFEYADEQQLLNSLQTKVIAPAENKKLAATKAATEIDALQKRVRDLEAELARQKAAT